MPVMYKKEMSGGDSKDARYVRDIKQNRKSAG